ncbi:MAG: hypothetical protein BYD32DRAFT_404122 [Podila humilis]|nr:MAG: hypothetical protein BYD32DRAFT_404122 [Podila humilis]
MFLTIWPANILSLSPIECQSLPSRPRLCCGTLFYFFGCEGESGKGKPWIPFPRTVFSANRIDSTSFGPND